MTFGGVSDSVSDPETSSSQESTILEVVDLEVCRLALCEEAESDNPPKEVSTSVHLIGKKACKLCSDET